MVLSGSTRQAHGRCCRTGISFFDVRSAQDFGHRKSAYEVVFVGVFGHEALYSLLNGIMITGVFLVTFIKNTSAVLHYRGGGETHTLIPQAILLYWIAIVLLCFGSAIN